LKPIDSNLHCPSCDQPLRPVQLRCDACNLTVEAPFRLNEFATLAPDDLHFLRIFVGCEGRIRDMEASLGLSYPTIRTRLTALKHKLQGAETAADPTPSPAAPDDTIQAVLNELQAGKVTFAVEQIKRARAGSSSTQP
jgi:hypothetical protein